MSPIVRIADPRGSTPRPLSLVAVVVGSVVAGLLLLKLSLVAPRPETMAPEAGMDDGASAAPHGPADEQAAQETHDAPEPAEAEAAPEADAGATAVAVVDAGTGGAPVAEAEVPAAAPEAAGAMVDAEPTAGGDRTLVHGRVAYFQCPNDECPRDHGLERSVWRALDRLGGCMGSGGQADVRVAVQAGAVSEVRFRERGAEGIDIGVLSRCVTAPLMRVTGSTLPDGAVVSFRFDAPPP